MKGDAAKNTCTFYHSAPDTVKDHWTTFETFVPVDDGKYDKEKDKKIDLSKSFCLQSRELSYDKAGHISKNQIKQYLIPGLNVFTSFQVDNTRAKDKNIKIPVLSELGEEIVSADGFSKLTISSGNQWIIANGLSGDKKCMIYHKGSDLYENNSALLTDDKKNIVIKPLKKIDDVKDIPGGDDSCIELNLGQDVYLQANTAIYDIAGHIKSIEKQYFKFPLVETSKILDEHEKIINTYTTKVDNFKKRLDTFDDTLKSHTSSINSINTTNDAQSTDITNLENLCGTKSDFTAKNKVNLCSGIGNIDYLRNNGKNSSDQEKLAMSLSDLNGKDNPTLCDYINALKKEIISLGNTSTKVITLETEINEIKEKLGMK